MTECAFVTRAFWRGRAVDQLQMHLKGAGTDFSAALSFSPNESVGRGGYRTVTACFDEHGNEAAPAGVCPVYETGSPYPTFAIVKPAVDNTRVGMSPYGQSVFADAVDAIQAVDLASDAMISEIDNGKMRVFLSDVMFDQETDGRGRKVSIPFGRQDMAEVRVTMNAWEYRQKWYGEDEKTAKARARGLARGKASNGEDT